MNRRYEFPGCEAREHAWGEIVFADAVAQLKVLMEHGAKSQGYGLHVINIVNERRLATKNG